MGIIIGGMTETREPPYPIGVRVTLECDAATEFFCRGFAHFEHADGFVGAHAMAMSAGWLERQSSQGRLWLCPECSGKGT
jgi:hypothetical protein